MKRAADAIYSVGVYLARAVGLEGAFLIAGTALLAAGSTYVSPAGPLFVVGTVCMVAALGLALPQRRS